MIVTQAVLIVGIALMATLSPSESLTALAGLAVAVSFTSASFDIAYDAFVIDSLEPVEKPRGEFLSLLGYRVAMIVSGGLSLTLATQYGWPATYLFMSVLMLVGVVGTLWADDPHTTARTSTPPRSIREAFIGPLQDFLSRRGALLALSTAILFKLGDAFAGVLTTPFFIRYMEFTQDEVGRVGKIWGLFVALAGSFAGGEIMRRISLYRALMLFGVFQAVTNLGFYVMAILPKSVLVLFVVVTLEDFCAALGTIAFATFLRALCNKKFSATQYALLSALSTVGRTFIAGPNSGLLVDILGWPVFFIVTFIISIPGLVLLRYQRSLIEGLSHGNHPHQT
jgi:PAT family beta-lactamase induction signal transducer AmpG